MKLKIVGLDPSLTHTGIAIMEYDVAAAALDVSELRLIVTENQKGKQVRQNSDDLRRAREVVAGIHSACTGALFAVSEGKRLDPTVSPFARASGMMVMACGSPC
ncbi:hypothetical protein SB778_32140, partial [Paraburkholderia sp. SIMBA_050]